MIIAINRYYIGTKQEHEVLLNTRYIQKIEEANKDKAKTIIIMEAFSSNGHSENQIIYTNETIAAIKQKIGVTTKANPVKRSKKTQKKIDHTVETEKDMYPDQNDDEDDDLPF